MKKEITLNYFNKTEVKRFPKAKFKRAIGKAFDLKYQRTGSLNIIFLTDEEIIKINKEYLNHDWATDVISFSLEDNEVDGEIYISLDRAKEQAEEYNATFYDEVIRLIAHGALHILGWDDETDEQREEMKAMEDLCIEAANAR